MLPYYDYQDLSKQNYKIQLRKDINKTGILLIVYFVVTLIVSFVSVLVPTILTMFNSTNTQENLLEDTSFLMLVSGFTSLVTFFLVTIIYSIIVKADFSRIYPFEKVSGNTVFLLCSLGLAVAMIANYASNLLLGLFDLVGIDANIDMDYKCDSALDVILFFVTVAIVPALVEEFAFRGIILGSLRKHSDSLAVLVSGVVFGLMHGNFAQIPFAIVVGLILGYITVKTNSLLPAIIIHFLNNSISVALTLLSTNTNLPEYIINMINIAVMLIIGIVGLISFIVLSTKHKGFFKLSVTDNIISFKEKLTVVCSNPSVIIFTVLVMFEAILTLNVEV